jgi:hypothetical protein
MLTRVNPKTVEVKAKKWYGDELASQFVLVEQERMELVNEINLTESIQNENHDRRKKRVQ